MVPSWITINLYQIEWAAGAPAWAGSPGSAVAAVMSAFVVPPNPAMTMALAKLSFGGGAAPLAVEANPIQADIPSGIRPRRPRKEIFIRNLRITLYSIKPTKNTFPLRAPRPKPGALRRTKTPRELRRRRIHAHAVESSVCAHRVHEPLPA